MNTIKTPETIVEHEQLTYKVNYSCGITTPCAKIFPFTKELKYHEQNTY
ncbi:hypothetical protein LDG_5432 [Legionella drancourtii LLAP12]|uniref:Uncharacterized protein n=1 Tax=Legionella drancourtii LLAP12 TaxID=658187 RepID=G9EJR6_9GAMM|nr:hypothetical protein LDG_5432 [Legionella drancourtii LLAP12]